LGHVMRRLRQLAGCWSNFDSNIESNSANLLMWQ